MAACGCREKPRTVVKRAKLGDCEALDLSIGYTAYCPSMTESLQDYREDYRKYMENRKKLSL